MKIKLVREPNLEYIFFTLNKAVSVLCLLQYADCIGLRILFLSRCSWSWQTISRSISFDIYFKFEIGRKFFITVLKVSFLINGVMTADLRSSGTNAKFIEELTIRVIVGVNALHLFNNHVGIGSSEQLFCGDFCINLAISPSVVALKCVSAIFLSPQCENLTSSLSVSNCCE